MNFKGFKYNSNNELCCEHASLKELGEKYKTPLYVYSGESIVSSYKRLERSLSNTKTEIHFALKANSTLGILSLLSKLGSGADIVSGGELKKALYVNIPASKIVFSGVGKTEEEIKLAINNGIKQINAESYPEIEKIIEISKEYKTEVPVAIRVNPDIEVKTHEKIATGSSQTKFGLPMEEAVEIYKKLANEKYIKTMGLAIHIGSQVFDMSEFKLAYKSILLLANNLRKLGYKVPNLDLGGGLGVNYHNGLINFSDYGETIYNVFSNQGFSLSVEPGRSIVANSGILLTKIIFIKETNNKKFIIVDGAMNDFIRPTLYNAHHNIEPVNISNKQIEKYDVVGPICETGDYFIKNLKLGKPEEGELLSIFSAGAYGAVMSSNYNSRPPAGEIIIFDEKVHVLKIQETIENQIKKENLPIL